MTDHPLKIAFVVDRFGNKYGGAEAYGVELMRELSKTHDITVFAREYDAACPLQVPFVPLRSWRNLPSWIRVLLFAVRARRHTREGFDIVHSHMNGWCGDVEVAHVTPVRYNWRVRPLPWYKKWLSRISPRVQTYLGLESRRVAQRPGHRIVAVSGLIAHQLQQAYGDQLKPPVIPPGVSPVGDVDPLLRGEVRTAFGWTDSDTVCLLVARNPLRKGLPTVLRALALLPPHVKLLVVGGNAAAREFTVRFQDGALGDRVRIVGETPDVGRYYGAADIYVHPTLNDSFGMAPLEAMAFGLPVIVSPSPWCGFAQYVENHSEALVLDHPEDAQQLAHYIEKLSQDPDLVARLARGAATVVKRHSWEQVARRYMQLYSQVLEAKRGAGVATATATVE